MNHEGAVENELGSDHWNAVCPCGWLGPDRETEKRAAVDLIGHYRDLMVRGEPSNPTNGAQP